MTTQDTQQLPDLPPPEVLDGHYRDHTDKVNGYSESQVRALLSTPAAPASADPAEPRHVARVGIGPFSHTDAPEFAMIEGVTLPDGVHDLYTSADDFPISGKMVRGSDIGMLKVAVGLLRESYGPLTVSVEMLEDEDGARMEALVDSVESFLKQCDEVAARGEPS